MKVVVTGATSFIGKYLIDELLKGSDEVIAIIRPNSKNKSNLDGYNNLKIIEVDLSNIQCLKDKLDNVDLCYHLAWSGTRIPDRYDEILQKSNYINTLFLFETLTVLGCKTFIGIGSQAEYGICNSIIKEDTLAIPNTAYGKYKLATCEALLKLGKEKSIRVIWGRVFSVYGVGDNPNTLLMSSICKMQNNIDIDMTEATQKWNYLFVKDLAVLLVMLVKNKNSQGIYNLASEDSRMLKDYIIELKEILDSNSLLNFGAIPYSGEGKINLTPCIDRLKQIIKDFSFTSFKDGINNIVSRF